MADPRTLSRRRLGTLTAFLANGFGMGAWSIEIAPVKATLGVSDAVMGALLLGFAAAALVAMPACGALAARVAAHRLCAASGLVFAAGLALPGTAGTVVGLAAVLTLFGVGHGTLDVIMNGRASTIETAAGRPWMSSFHAAWSVGGAAGAGSAGLLTGYGWTANDVLPLAALIVALLALASAIGAEPFEHGPPPDRSTSARRLPARAIGVRLIAFCVIAFCALLTEGALTDWSSIYLSQRLTGVDGGFAIGYIAFAAGMTASRLAGDRCVARCGPARVAGLGAFVASMAFALVLWRPSLGTAGACFAAIGLGLGNVVPIAFSQAGRAGSSAARGVALAASAGYAGLLLGPVAIGVLAELSSLRAALCLLIVTTLVMAGLGGIALRSAHPETTGRVDDE